MKRPKTTKEKVYVTIKKSSEPVSVYMIAIKLKVSTYIVQRDYIPDLIVNGCIEELPKDYAILLRMMAGDSKGLQSPKVGGTVKFYKVTPDHFCKFCEVFQ